MLNLLEKFENVEIKNDTRLNDEDLKVVEGYQEQFDKFKKQFLKYENFYIKNPLDAPIYEKEYNYNATQSNKMLESLCENFMKDGCEFISRIYRYFQDKYNVSLENNFNKGTEYCIKYRKLEALKRMKFYKNELNYNIIIDDIFVQLDGFDFNSKAEQELKQNFKSLFSYRNGNNDSSLKNKKVSIKSFFYIDSFDRKWRQNRVSYYSKNNFEILGKILTHFEYGTIHNAIKNTTNRISEGEGDRLFEKYELIFDKIDSIKLYKNGKLDINFSSGQYARDFAKEYCGLEV